MKIKNLLSSLKESSLDFYNNIKSAEAEFWVATGGLVSAGYGIYKGDSRIIIPALTVSLLAGAYKTYKDFFSSEREQVPEALRRNRDLEDLDDSL